MLLPYELTCCKTYSSGEAYTTEGFTNWKNSDRFQVLLVIVNHSNKDFTMGMVRVISTINNRSVACKYCW